MNLTELLAVYALIGLVCAVAVYHRSPPPALRRLVSAAVTVPLWPLWTPFALAAGPRPAGSGGQAQLPLGRQVDTVLAEALEAIAGTPAEGLLSRADALAIRDRVLAAAARLGRLQAQLSRPSFDSAAAAGRVAELERQGASETVLTTARLHLRSLERLEQCCRRQEQELAELVDLLQIMRAQLLLARYGSDSHPGELLTEIWARLEGMGAVEDCAEPRPEPPPSSDLR